VELLVPIVVALAAAVAVVLVWSWWSRRRAEAPTREPSAAEAEAPPRLADRLGKTRRGLAGRLRGVFQGERVGNELYEGLEEALIAADVGVETSAVVVAHIRDGDPSTPAEARRYLRDELIELFADRDRSLKVGGHPAVVVIVGVNGVGKTTTVAKLAHHLRQEGLESLLGAADTFRAAGDAQLAVWARRLNVQVVAGASKADPAAVAFDAYQAARARGKDVVIIDTAGRLHDKHNLMEELGKIIRVLRREAGEVDEVLLVLDASIGQNGLVQTREFASAAGVTGIVLTKLDGTARGGIVIAAERMYDIPVKFVGVGERLDDLVSFDPEEFVDALLMEDA
jgi:fused signal recognition particle receptor